MRKYNSKARILFVDDSKMCLILAKTIFEKYLDADVYVTSDVEEALSYIDKNHTELASVITDMRMPKMNGTAFLKEIRSKYDENALPVIVMTGFPFTKEQTDEIFELGAIDILEKDFDMKSKGFDLLVKRLSNYIKFCLHKKNTKDKKANLKQFLDDIVR